MKILVTLTLVAALVTPAWAQLRTIPKEAKSGVLRHLQEMVVEIDGKPARLSAGAQIRDADNRLVLPASLLEKSAVRYVLDREGMVHRVWILTPQEKAALPPDPIPK